MKHALTVALLLVGPAGAARAADLPCGPAEKGTVQLDGLTDDWAEVTGVDAGGRDPNASFSLKCNVEDGRTLLVLLDVRDNYMVRTRQGRPGEDHLVLTLAGQALTVFPGDAGTIPTVVKVGARPAAKVKAVSAMQPKGYAVELAVPLASLPGYKAGMPLAYRAELADSDSKADSKTERTVVVDGTVVFAEGDSALDAFLNDRKLRRGDIWFDKGARLGGKSGARLVMAGRNLAAITDGYTYVELPIQSRSDVKDARLVDLAGDGRQALALRYVDRGVGAQAKEAGGAREVLAVYRVAGESEIRRVFAAEVGKAVGQGRIEDTVAFVKRGRATDIVIDVGRADGVTAATFHEAPAEDVIPILLPWGDDRHARYQFAGDEYKRAQ
jgi:hypothetical protein